MHAVSVVVPEETGSVQPTKFEDDPSSRQQTACHPDSVRWRTRQNPLWRQAEYSSRVESASQRIVSSGRNRARFRTLPKGAGKCQFSLLKESLALKNT